MRALIDPTTMDRLAAVEARCVQLTPGAEPRISNPWRMPDGDEPTFDDHVARVAIRAG
jgi:hypothetical protein